MAFACLRTAIRLGTFGSGALGSACHPLYPCSLFPARFLLSRARSPSAQWGAFAVGRCAKSVSSEKAQGSDSNPRPSASDLSLLTTRLSELIGLLKSWFASPTRRCAASHAPLGGVAPLVRPPRASAACKTPKGFRGAAPCALCRWGWSHAAAGACAIGRCPKGGRPSVRRVPVGACWVRAGAHGVWSARHPRAGRWAAMVGE